MTLPQSTAADCLLYESGLGLAISHRLVTLMQGTLAALSDGTQQGNRFTFSIPLDKSALIVSSESSKAATHQAAVINDEEGGGSSQPASPLLSSDPDEHHSKLSKTVLIVDPLPLRGRAIQELVKTLDLEHAFVSSIDQLRPLPLSHPAVHAPVILTHLQDHTSTNPTSVLTAFRATHVPESLNCRVIFVVDLGFQLPTTSSAPETIDGLCFVSKPITLHKLADAIRRLAPDMLEQFNSPIEPFAEPSQSDLTYDDDDLESFRENRLLMVDANPADQRAALMLLQQKGLKHIDSASNEAEALHLIQANSVPYDVIVIASEVQGATCELTRRILAMPKYARVPIIGLARSFLPEDAQQQFQSSGMKAVLAKPLDVHEFISLVQKYLLPGNVSAAASWARPWSQAMSSSTTPPSQLSQFIPLPP